MKKLTKLHRQAIKLLMDGELTMDEIAASVKKTRQTLYNWMKDPVFAAELEECRKQQRDTFKARIGRNAGYAIDRAKQILTKSDDDRAAAQVIADTLDRAGYPKIKQSDLNVNAKIENAGVVLIPRKLDERGADNGL